MTAVDIYIELFKRLGLKQVDELIGHPHNILIYEEDSYKCYIYFNYKTGIVSSIRYVGQILSLGPMPYKLPIFSGRLDKEIYKDTHNKQSLNDKYKDIIRDIKIKELL